MSPKMKKEAIVLEEKNTVKYKRYSLPVKILILFALIASTIAAGITGSWIMIGLNHGMSFKEVMNPVPFEESRQAGYYLNEEGHMLLDCISADQLKSLDSGNSGKRAWLIETPEETNIVFYLYDKENNTVYTNIEEWGRFSLGRVYQNYGNYRGADASDCFLVVNSASGSEDDSDLSSQISADAVSELNSGLLNDIWEVLSVRNEDNVGDYQLFVGLNSTYPVRDSWSYGYHQLYESYAESIFSQWPYIFFAALGIMIWMLILVGRQAGHNSGDREIHLKSIDRFPIEIWVVVDVVLVVIGIAMVVNGLNNSYWTYWAAHYNIDVQELFLGSAPVVTGGMLILSLTAAKIINLYGRRIKAKTLDGSAILAVGKRVVHWFQTLYESRRENQKLIIRYVVILIVNFFLLLIVFLLFGVWYPGAGFFFLLILILADVYMLYRLAKNEKGKDEIKSALKEISQGNLDYQIDTADMSKQNREMAEEVNRMRDGLKTAVETQLKSERLKTDLIANVSHDIKTPLTSIINYVDILDREHFEDERIAGYVDILVRKSARLKQLTEDLIEASKISSGNITLDMQEINLKQLIKQTNGEFEEKFAARHLQLVCRLPEENLMILADGRRMYRVLENLYNNAAKYAMPYSRVYVDGETEDGKVTFSIKNMSENPLNISADELMERFVRGDTARTTEGNGLGLEIARNLTVMQHGKFYLHLDGDLFKVVIVFGEPEEEPQEPEADQEQTNEKEKSRSKKTKKQKREKKHVRLRFRNPITVETEETQTEDEMKS